MNRTGRTASLVIGGLCIVVGLVLIGIWLTSDEASDDRAQEQSEKAQLSPENFRIAVDAVAATEETNFELAVPLWAKLLETLPDDPDIQANRAVAVLKWIDVLEKELSSGSADADRQQAVASELEQAYRIADEAIEKLVATDADDYRVPLIHSAILISKANRLQHPTDQPLRAAAAKVLSTALQQEPAQPLLATSLDDIATVLAGSQPELERDNMEYLLASWRATPRNLFLLRRAAELLLENEDPRLAELLPASIELTRPSWSLLQAQIDRLQPEQLVADALAAIERGEWEATRPLRFWLNIIRGMPGFLSDAKAMNPDPLALLDTSFLTRLAPETAPQAETHRAPQYTQHLSEEQATAAVWFDFDFDNQLEIAAVSGSELYFLKLADRTLEVHQRIALPTPANGILAVDLFEVDSPARPTLPSNVAELMQADVVPPETPPADPANTPEPPLHDTLRDLLVWGSDGIQVIHFQPAAGEESGSYQLLDTDTGLESLRDVTGVIPADFESDGDLDLLVTTSAGLHLLQNNGNRTFKDITEFSLLPEVHLLDAVACDFDRDLDQDFVGIAQGSSQLIALENIQHGQFRYRVLDGEYWETAVDAQRLAFGDFDGNSSWEWLVLGTESSSHIFTANPSPGQLTATRTAQLPTVAGESLATGDLNNDGLLDIVFGGSDGMRIVYGLEGYQFSAPQTISERPTLGIALVDQNGDGTLDVLALSEGRPIVWLSDRDSSAESTGGDYLNVRVAGINDVNGGGRVNHYGLGSVLEIWSSQGVYQARHVGSPQTHFGLGEQDPINLRIIFPNGLTQNVRQVTANTLIEEKQVLRGSCPYVYGWNGERFELITDLLWNAPLGLQIARGKVLPDRRWENLLLPGELVQARDGYYELRITEELWEIAYFDHVQLIAVDHSSGQRLFTNEKVGPPSLAEHRLITAQKKRYARHASDMRGRDIKTKLSATDRDYVQPFDYQICQGLCEPHYIELDFGPLPTSEPLRLFLNGWMYPTDTSLNIGIDQNVARPAPEPPSLWVVGEDGEWVCARDFIGFPGGKPKSIVVDLNDVFESTDHRLRIGGSQQIYWDEAFVSWDSVPWESHADHLQVQPLELATAELRYRGFSQLLPRSSEQPHWYDYHMVETSPQWPSLEGPFTRYGDVAPLLAHNDDSMVVMTSGDEIVLRFRLPAKPTADGWQRDFVLHSVGWDKDADINTLAGEGSLPLPFKLQSSYPPPAEQADEADRVWRLNSATLTRWTNGSEHQPTAGNPSGRESQALRLRKLSTN